MRWMMLVACVLPLVCGCKEGGFLFGGEAQKPLDNTSPAKATSNMVRPAADGTVSRMVINGEVVEAEEILAPLKEELEEKSASMAPKVYAEYAVDRIGRAVTERIAEALLHQQAENRLGKDEGKALDAAVDSELRARITRDHGGVQRRYENVLQLQGRTLEDARNDLRRQFIVLRYLEFNIKPKVQEPTRDELLVLFEQNRSRWERAPRRSMSLVEVSVRARLPVGAGEPGPEVLAAARTEAQQRIEAADSAVRAGTPFAEVARQYSDGLQASTGGSWGFVTTGGVVDRYRPAVEAMEKLGAGEVSPIIEQPDVFFLVRCDEVDGGAVARFEDVQLELKEEHFKTEYNRLIGEHVEEIRRRARVEPENMELFFRGVLKIAPQPRSQG